MVKLSSVLTVFQRSLISSCCASPDSPVLWESISWQHQCFSLSSVFRLCGSGEQAGNGGGSIHPQTREKYQEHFARRSAAHRWNFCQPEAGRGHTAGTFFKVPQESLVPHQHSIHKSFFLHRDMSLIFPLVLFYQPSSKEAHGAPTPSNPPPVVSSSVPAVRPMPRSSSPVRKNLDSSPARFLSPSDCHTVESEAESLLEEPQRSKDPEGSAGENADDATVKHQPKLHAQEQHR